MIDKEGRLFVDNSTLRAVAECSTQAVLRYGLGYTSAEDAASLRAGQAAHEALAAWALGAEPSAALLIFTKHYGAWAKANVEPDNRLDYTNCFRILGRWLEENPVKTFPFHLKLDTVEQAFALPLADDVMFTGRIDARGEGEDGSIRVIDHKTTGSIANAKRSWRVDSSFTGYVWAAREQFGEDVIGAVVNGIEFSRLPSDATRKCPKHSVKYAECGVYHARWEVVLMDRTPDEIEEWRKTALHLARRWRDLLTRYRSLEDLRYVRTQGRFHHACAYCGFYDFCLLGRPIDRVQTMLVYEPWDPRGLQGKGDIKHVNKQETT